MYQAFLMFKELSSFNGNCRNGSQVIDDRFLGVLGFSQELPNDGQEFVVIHGLLEVSLGSSLEGPVSVFALVTGGHHDDRNRGKVYVRFEPLHDDKSVAGGQAQIKDDQVRSVLACLGHAGQGIGREEGIVIVGFEADVVAQAQVGIIFDNKDFLIRHE